MSEGEGELIETGILEEGADEEDLPALSEDPDNDPEDEEAAQYQEPDEVQDREGTERPVVDKHPEEE
jgi:hypothetical protein